MLYSLNKIKPDLNEREIFLEKSDFESERLSFAHARNRTREVDLDAPSCLKKLHLLFKMKKFE